MTGSLNEALRQIVDAAEPAVVGAPPDCTLECDYALCNCSGVRPVIGWKIDVPKLRELLGSSENE